MLLLLHVHKELTDTCSVEELSREFITANEEQNIYFSTLETVRDSQQLWETVGDMKQLKKTLNKDSQRHSATMGDNRRHGANLEY